MRFCHCHAEGTVSTIAATGVDKHLQHLLSNEKLNFKLLSEAVQKLGGIPPLMTWSDMSNTLPDEKVSAVHCVICTYNVGHFCYTYLTYQIYVYYCTYISLTEKMLPTSDK